MPESDISTSVGADVSRSSLDTLETEKVNPATVEIDRMGPLEIVQVMNAEDAKVAEAIKREEAHIAEAIEAITARLRRGGRLVYIGAGTSGRLGVLDAAECPPTFNLPPDKVIGCVAGGPIAQTHASEDAEDSAEAGKADVAQLNITEADAVVGITASGRTPYALGAITYAKSKGALTIGIACNQDTLLEKEVDIMIAPIVGPEVITGSTRLKAGTAQKMVLNMLSTGTMILLGKTFGNLMVDVQTTNYKLHQRALKVVQRTTGVDRDRAEALLQVSGGETKTAIVVGLTNIEPQRAKEQLAIHDGVLRKTLEALQ
ncbi:MAG: N-acetylmuramic acid 6-phosphate etherase [Chloroflexota bacterium]|nr:N-acetylmuramic acid 6-phosphate etherase [Chloroflexota bacterium]